MNALNDQFEKIRQEIAKTRESIALCQDAQRQFRKRLAQMQRESRKRETDALHILPPIPFPQERYSNQIERIDALWKSHIDALATEIEKHESKDLSEQRAKLQQLQAWPGVRDRLQQGIQEKRRPIFQERNSALLARTQGPPPDEDETERLLAVRPPRRIEDIETKRLPPMPLYYDNQRTKQPDKNF